jgi:hypothetical protein
VDGVWVASSPCAISDVGDVDKIGRDISHALEVSRVGVPRPDSWERVVDPLLFAAGVKSWSAFARSAKLVAIEAHDGRVLFLPMLNWGSRGGFQRTGAGELSVDATSDLLGSSLLEAFKSAA